MNKYIISLIALVGILAIFALNLSPVSAWSSTTQASATVVDTISVTLSYDSGTSLTFGNLNSGTTDNPATNHLIISIDPATNVATDINQSATGDFSGTSGSFALNNLKYNATNDGSTSAEAMAISYQNPTPFAAWTDIGIPSGSAITRNTYYWLSIPEAQPAGDYSTTINIQVTKH
jgi:hypothetical protein